MSDNVVVWRMTPDGGFRPFDSWGAARHEEGVTLPPGVYIMSVPSFDDEILCRLDEQMADLYDKISKLRETVSSKSYKLKY